ncbi:MAG: DUF2812 domain-containing protein [Acutalibacteraceae bacterium]|nr:DUF2812 domain-containing protein [Acutalibacteraceae bacterium]
MRQTIHKLFWVWDFDKEEKWLNEMAAKGLSLVSVGFCKYEFEDSMPGEYKVCLQLLDKFPRHPESKKYIEFLETTGAEHVGSFTRWVYFRKKATEGDFELFSDNDSRLKYLSSVISFVSLITVGNWIAGINNVFIATSFPSPINYVGILNLLIGLVGTWGVIRLIRKRKKMKQDGQLFE